MIYVIIFITSFILVMAYYYFFEIKSKKKRESNHLPNELLFLKKVYNINVEKIGRTKVLWHVALINSFGISAILLLTNLVSKYILKLILALALAVIYSIGSNYILGKIYVSKGYAKKKTKKDK